MNSITKPFHTRPKQGKTGSVKGFRVLHKAWNSDVTGQDTPEIVIGVYYPDGSTSGEFGIKWDGAPGASAPCLEVHGDAWKEFADMPELHKMLGTAGRPDAYLLSERQPSPDWIVDQLKTTCGYTDLTQYDPPD